MIVLRHRRAVEELAHLLDGGVTGPATSVGATDSTTLAVRVRGLAPSMAAATTPDPAFRAALRSRLVAVAAVSAPRPVPVDPVAAGARVGSWSRRPAVQRRLGLAAGTTALVVACTGVAVATSRSLPGGPLYGLKRGVEGVRLDLAGGDLAKGQFHLHLAALRLREVAALARGDTDLSLGTGAAPAQALGGSRSTRLVGTLATMDDDTRAGQRLLVHAFLVSGQQASLRQLAGFAGRQQTDLRQVLPLLPPGAQAAGRASLTLVASVGGQAAQLLARGDCRPACGPAGVGPSTKATPGAGHPVPGCPCPPGPSGVRPAPGVPPASRAGPAPRGAPSPGGSPPGAPSPATPPSGPSPVLPLPVPLPDSPLPLPIPLPSPLPTGLPTLPLPLGLAQGDLTLADPTG